MGGGTPEIKYLSDERILFDYFFPGALQGDAFHTPTVDFSPGSPAFNQVFGALVSGFAPPDFRTVQFFVAAKLQVTNPFNPNPTELITSGLTGAGFSARFTNDLLSHTHGHIPYDNTQVVYSTGGVGNDAALNAGVERFTSHPDAVHYLQTYYDPEGQARLPFLTLHTLADPEVPFFHEALYATKVAQAGGSDLLVQRTVSRYGHCNFKVAEIMNSFDALAIWVANPAQKPSGGDVTIP